MMENTIVYFEKDSGHVPFIEWLDSLSDKKGEGIILNRLERIKLGLFGDSKYLKDGVYEIRIKYGSGYRVYYTKHNNTIVIILCGGNKSGQTKDINTAIKYAKQLKDYNNA